MIKTIKNAWKIDDLRRKIKFTLLMLLVFRLGIHVPVPGINSAAWAKQMGNGMLFGLLDIVSGGGLKNFSIFAMGVQPYITSSIVMSLLVIAIPSLEQLQKEGEDGRKKIATYTRYGTIIFALMQSIGITLYMSRSGVMASNSWFDLLLVVVTIVTGTVFVMWLGEKMTEKGLGNGTSLIIFTGIIAKLPSTFAQIINSVSVGTISPIAFTLFIAAALLSILGVVTMDLGERRIPVQYAQKKVGVKMYGGQSSHIPININSTGVIAIIFALSVVNFPTVIFSMVSKPGQKLYDLFVAPEGFFGTGGYVYPVIYILLIVFFTWFYTSITFKPEEVSENLQKSGGFIPGIRPGKPTEEFITRVLNRMTVIGGVFASLVAVSPIILSHFKGFTQVSLGGTMLLIMVGVALELKKQIKSHLVMRHYEGFLK